MPRKPKPPAEETAPVRYTEAVVGEGSRALGDLLCLLHGGQAAGLALKAASGVLATAAGRVHNFLSEMHARRVEEVAAQVRGALPEGEAEECFERLADLVTEAAPLVAEIGDVDRRRMIANILTNAAGATEDAIARVEALRAMQMIAEMPDEAAILFAWIAARDETRPVDVERLQACSSDEEAEAYLAEYLDQDRAGMVEWLQVPQLPHDLQRAAMEYLFRSERALVMSDMEVMTTRVRRPKEKVVTTRTEWEEVEETGPRSTGFVHLTDTGRWLRDWIREHPLPEQAAGSNQGHATA